MYTPFDHASIQKLATSAQNAHKGDNGRLLVIGGSQLFHASIFWSADIASRIVDLVHFTSPASENNDLVRKKAKAGFWNGIVIDFSDIDSYIVEDDSVLIGPGMPRPEGLTAGEISTADITNHLLTKYPFKRWIIDGGAVQEVDPSLLRSSHILTPHQGEWERLISKVDHQERYRVANWDDLNDRYAKISLFSKEYRACTILAKGMVDLACQGEEGIAISGGNPGLSKGGTGDVLAGLVAALYTSNDSLLATSIASYLLKTAADQLFEEVNTMYNTSDLVQEIPKIWAAMMQGH